MSKTSRYMDPLHSMVGCGKVQEMGWVSQQQPDLGSHVCLAGRLSLVLKVSLNHSTQTKSDLHLGELGMNLDLDLEEKRLMGSLLPASPEKEAVGTER